MARSASLGNTYSVADGHRFRYTSVGGTDGLAQQFEISVIDDIGTAATTINQDRVLDTDSVISVADSTGFAVGDFIRVVSEMMLITNVAGNNLSVARAQLGSQATLAVSGAEVARLQISGISVVANSASASANTIDVKDASVLALDLSDSRADYVRIGDEIVRVDAVSANQLTVRRGQLGTAAASHNANEVVSRIELQRVTTIDEMRVGLSGLDEPATFLQNDTVLEVTKLDSFDPVAGDLLLIGDEVLSVIGVVDNGTTLSINVNRGEFGTPVVEVPVGSSVAVIDSNVAPDLCFRV